VSKAFDGGFVSRWGRVWWHQKAQPGQSVRLKLRTGNSGEPDELWSDWTSWCVDPAGQPLDVPMGRFAQFSAELKTRPGGDSPRVLEVNVSYRQLNRKPAIQDLADALKTGREPELSARKALQATELIFATYESSRKRGRVDLPLEIEEIESLMQEKGLLEQYPSLQPLIRHEDERKPK